MQISGTALVVSIGMIHPLLDLHTEIQIKGVAVSSDHIAAWSGRTVIVYQLLLGESVSISVEGNCSFYNFSISYWYFEKKDFKCFLNNISRNISLHGGISNVVGQKYCDFG